MANRFFDPGLQYLDNSGNVLSGGSITFTLTGSSTPANTYTNAGLTVANTNPVVLDSAGRPTTGAIFLDPAVTYAAALKTSAGVTIWTRDPVTDPAANVSAAFQAYAGNPNGFVAGNAGAVGGSGASTVYDITNHTVYVCTTTGDAGAALWTAVTGGTAALNAANVFTADQTVQLTDAGAGGGPNLSLYRISATPAANDELASLQFHGRDSGGNKTLYASIVGQLDDPTDGSEDGSIYFRYIAAGSFATKMLLGAGFLGPATNDGLTLGTASFQWSDIFLASGAVININSGDVLLTHSANALAFSGASSGYSFDAKLFPATDDGAPLGDTTHNFSDLFLASGAVVNWNNGDVTLTHSSNTLTFAGASSGYIFDAALSIGTSAALTAGSIELGAASDTTLSRSAAGQLSVEGKPIGMMLLTSGSASGATLDIDLTAYTTYKGIKIILSGFRPATDAVSLLMRFSSNGGSSFDATGYNWTWVSVDSSGVSIFNNGSANAGITTSIQVTSAAIGNASTEGVNAEIDISNQSSAAFYTRAVFRGYYMDNDPTSSGNFFSGGGARETAQDTDAVRFLFSSGNITAGNYQIYGLA